MTLGTFLEERVGSRLCERGPAAGCRTRQLAGGSAATVCSCSGDFFNLQVWDGPDFGREKGWNAFEVVKAIQNLF